MRFILDNSGLRIIKKTPDFSLQRVWYNVLHETVDVRAANQDSVSVETSFGVQYFDATNCDSSKLVCGLFLGKFRTLAGFIFSLCAIVVVSVAPVGKSGIFSACVC